MEAALSHSVESAAEITGLGRTTIYELIKEKRIVALKVGRRRLITADALRQFLAEREAEAAADRRAA